MFIDGEWWIPPNQDEEINPDQERMIPIKGFLGQIGQRKLIWLLRGIDLRRGSIARGMGFAIDRSDAAEEVCFIV